MMRKYSALFKGSVIVTLLLLIVVSPSLAEEGGPTYAEVKAALKEVVAEKNGGFGLNMWATVVDRDGVVKIVVFSGAERGDQWPGSR